ncbi:hypothetical protein P1J78_22845 [Psychromarinibacter sp. C21-152]|uniref:Uncharacterized protein n=1 Tax=Psychromarinibacter sediminicola TaxID=3033385 RepID=A0AAE3NZI9_9RHOB|nr:hypothetical protein [Psychromarinibacter sediminicola]MDF0603572.1 hypothetical protein [Psychromarinibacter sediminicola]
MRWDSQFVFRSDLYWVRSDTYYCNQRKDGVVLLGKNSDPYNPLGHVPADKAEDFIAAALQRFESVPRSCFGKEDCRRMERKQDAAMRDLISGPHVADCRQSGFHWV